MRYTLRPPLAIPFLALLAAPTALAQAGALDPTFGGDGTVTTALGFDRANHARAVGVQDDGRILTVGFTGVATVALPDSMDFALTRYYADGALDPTFGGDGSVVTDFGSPRDVAHAVALQPDGRIVAAGESAGRFALARYHPDGALDPSFGDGGLVTTAFGANESTARGVVLQSDGRIVAAGFTWTGARYAFALARYHAHGVLDPSFGSGGLVTTTFSPGDARALDIALQDDGRIVVVGSTGEAAISSELALARYDTDGVLDPTFGDGGLVTTVVGAFAFGYAVAVQDDGRILAAGESNSGAGSTSDFTLARYDADGALDSTFGSGGLVTTSFGPNNDVALALAIQADGRIVAAGTTATVSSLDFALARYDTDGVLDPTFGNGGLVSTAFGEDTDGALALALHPDGRIVAAGYTFVGFVGGRILEDIALARYLGDADLAVSAAPLGAPAVPAGGGRFAFTVTVANATDRPQAVSVWTAAAGPTTFAPALKPLNVTLGPYEIVTDTLRQRVPGTSPAGDYVYTVHVGSRSGLPSSTRASFPIEKAAPRRPAWADAAAPQGTAAGAAPLTLMVPTPHPFRTDARLPLAVPSAQSLRVAIYDALGREVAVLLDGSVAAGTYVLALDGAALAPGIYVVRAEGAGGYAARRVIRY